MDQKEIEETRARFNMSGGANTFKNEGVKGVGGGGRIGVSKELDSGDRISAGISGNASKVKVDTEEGEKTFKQKKITGIDASYSRGDTTYGVSASRQPMMDGKIDKKINLSITKSFAKGGDVTKKTTKTPIKQTKKQTAKVAKVMGEFKEGSLHSGKGGKVVKSPKQAVAIALSEANVKAKKK
jgi:hypothetical protein